MNTGVQRSGATPFGASTTTSPAGAESFGKAQKRKDMTAIAIGHHIPYVAQAVASHWHDLSVKVERAAAVDGPAFLNVLTDCPVGWGHEPRLANQILDAAVDTPLLAAVRGRRRAVPAQLRARPASCRSRSGSSARRGSRTCFGPRTAPPSRPIQAQIDADWAELVARCEPVR